MRRATASTCVIAADEPEIDQAAEQLRERGGAVVEAVEADLATIEGVDKLWPPLARPAGAMRCSPMPAAGWAGASWTRTSTRRATSSTPTSPARSI